MKKSLIVAAVAMVLMVSLASSALAASPKSSRTIITPAAAEDYRPC